MLKTGLTFCLIILLFSINFAQTEGNQDKVVFKANTEFAIQLETIISSEKNNVGDDVNFILTEDVVAEGNKIEKGSIVYGRIVSIEKISAKNDTTKLCIMFDFVKKGENFMSLEATIVAIEPNTEAIKLSDSTKFSGGTTLALKSKEILIDKGRIFRIKLNKVVTTE